jgi:hypothetical protein
VRPPEAHVLANGYSPAATHVAASADRKMDTWYNALPGIPYGNHLTVSGYQNRMNPEHGERGEDQTCEQAEAVTPLNKNRLALVRICAFEVSGLPAPLFQGRTRKAPN